jgi:hypothetical protein
MAVKAMTMDSQERNLADMFFKNYSYVALEMQLSSTFVRHRKFTIGVSTFLA